MSCPDPDRLAALPALNGDERAAIIDHAAGCAGCHAIVAELLPHNPALAATVDEDPAAISPESAAPLAQIDRYQIVRTIGAGAMGVVYAANDPELARPVAVKVLRAGGSPERMRREAQALAKLAHKNVVAVYDVGEHAGSMFVAMALVAGDNLRSWLARPHPPEEILDAIVQAGRGVEAAHAAGIVHRDLKPDNIFVGESGDVLVGDFGLARSGTSKLEKTDPGHPSGDLTATGALLGTPAYMSPELLAGEASPASDQFALCVTAWEALYGERPFAAKTIEEHAAAVRRGAPRPPAKPNVPARVRAALRRGLAANPRERFPSVTALLAELAPRRRRWPYAVAALAIAAGVIAWFATRPSNAVDFEQCDELEAPRVTIRPGLPTDVAGALTATVDRYVEAWSATARTACMAHLENAISDPSYAAIQRCLDRRAITLRDILDTPDEPELLGVVEYLEPAENCRDASPTSDFPGAFQRELDRAMVRALAQRAVDVAPLVARADLSSAASTRAQAQFLLAITRFAFGLDAEPALVAAIQQADVARDDRLRTRATAMRATVAARAGRTADAVIQRGLAQSAAARGADPAAPELVERATIELAHATGDLAGEIRGLRAIESMLVARFGEQSIRLATVRFDIGAKLQAANDPSGDALVARALQMLDRLAPSRRDERFGAEESIPARRIVIDQQIVAVARRDRSVDLPVYLGGLAADCFLISDYVSAHLYAMEAAALAPAGKTRDELYDDAAGYALEAALHTEDKARRAKRLFDAIGVLDKMSPAAREWDSSQSTRGRALLAMGEGAAAIAPLAAAVDAAERAEPRHPFRIAVRSFALAQALWRVGGAKERARARMLVEQAHAAVPAARAMFEAKRKIYGSALARLEEVVIELDAWRRTHP